MIQMARTAAYIAGPMSGFSEHNFPAFRECADRLRRWTDWQVVNPVELELNATFPPGSLSREEYLKADIRELLDCTVLVRLGGWDKSVGAKAEVEVAKAIGCRIYDYLPGQFEGQGVTIVTVVCDGSY